MTDAPPGRTGTRHHRPDHVRPASRDRHDRPGHRTRPPVARSRLGAPGYPAPGTYAPHRLDGYVAEFGLSRWRVLAGWTYFNTLTDIIQSMIDDDLAPSETAIARMRTTLSPDPEQEEVAHEDAD